MTLQSDQHGTAAEQRRHAVQWIPAALRQSHTTYVPNRRCRNCRHCSKLVSYRCQKHGFTTQANACCRDFNKAFDA